MHTFPGRLQCRPSWLTIVVFRCSSTDHRGTRQCAPSQSITEYAIKPHMQAERIERMIVGVGIGGEGSRVEMYDILDSFTWKTSKYTGGPAFVSSPCVYLRGEVRGCGGDGDVAVFSESWRCGPHTCPSAVS